MSLSKNDITNGESNLTGTRAKERDSLVQNNGQRRMKSVIFASCTISLTNVRKMVTGCVASNVMSGATSLVWCESQDGRSR